MFDCFGVWGVDYGCLFNDLGCIAFIWLVIGCVLLCFLKLCLMFRFAFLVVLIGLILVLSGLYLLGCVVWVACWCFALIGFSAVISF